MLHRRGRERGGRTWLAGHAGGDDDHLAALEALLQLAGPLVSGDARRRRAVAQVGGDARRPHDVVQRQVADARVQLEQQRQRLADAPARSQHRDSRQLLKAHRRRQRDMLHSASKGPVLCKAHSFPT